MKPFSVLTGALVIALTGGCSVVPISDASSTSMSTEDTDKCWKIWEACWGSCRAMPDPKMRAVCWGACASAYALCLAS